MNNKFMEVTNSELDSGWYPALYILIGVSAILMIVIIIYFINLKYRIRYFVNGELVHTVYYKKNAPIFEYQYDKIDNWYIDEECTVLFTETVMPNKNMKLYATSTVLNYE